MKNMKKAVALGLMAAMVGLGAQSLVAPEQVSAKADLDTYFDFEPHRGGRDARPENTLYSYAYAIEVGASSIECDMQLTADGNIVMSHNPVLNPDITRYKDSGKYIEAGKYDIRTMTVPELKKFDVGVMDSVTAPEHYYNGHGKTQVTPDCAELPTIDEFFQLVKDSGFKGNINIETKLYPDPDFPEYANNADVKKFVKTFYDKVQQYGLHDQVILQSFDWASLVEMKKLDPDIATAALWCDQPSWGRDSEYLRTFEKAPNPFHAGLEMRDFNGNPVEAAHAIGADIVSPYFGELSKDQVNLAHKYGMKVVPWTVNDPKDIEMLVDMGCDGVITDKPWSTRPVLEAKGLKLRSRQAVAVQKYHLEPDHQMTETDKMVNGTDAAY